MKHILSAYFFVFLLGFAQAQPSTEVYLVKTKFTKKGLKVKNVQNISQNPGYDNQASFSADGKSILYAGTVEGQTDIIRYTILTQSKTRLTNTPGSEYSPTLSPNQDLISCIRLEKDGQQLLWAYDLEGKNPRVLVPDLKIGYHLWVNPQTLYTFVLGETSELQKIDLKTLENKLISKSIGRSLLNIPGEEAITYVDKTAENEWWITKMNINSGDIQVLAPTLSGAEDLAWLDQNTLLMASGSTLYRYQLNEEKKWEAIYDFKKHSIQGITRIAISPDGKYLALISAE